MRLPTHFLALNATLFTCGEPWSRNHVEAQRQPPAEERSEAGRFAHNMLRRQQLTEATGGYGAADKDLVRVWLNSLSFGAVNAPFTRELNEGRRSGAFPTEADAQRLGVRLRARSEPRLRENLDVVAAEMAGVMVWVFIAAILDRAHGRKRGRAGGEPPASRDAGGQLHLIWKLVAVALLVNGIGRFNGQGTADEWTILLFVVLGGIALADLRFKKFGGQSGSTHDAAS